MNSWSSTSGRVAGELQNGLPDATHQRHVPADPDLDVHRPGPGRVKRGHARRTRAGRSSRRDAASISGLMCTSRAPRRSASASQVSIRGALVAAFSPNSQIASACSQILEVGRSLPGPQRRAQRPAGPRGTCSSSPAGCWCRTRVPTTGIGTSPRWTADPRCKTLPDSGLSRPRSV